MSVVDGAFRGNRVHSEPRPEGRAMLRARRCALFQTGGVADAVGHGDPTSFCDLLRMDPASVVDRNLVFLAKVCKLCDGRTRNSRYSGWTPGREYVTATFATKN